MKNGIRKKTNDGKEKVGKNDAGNENEGKNEERSKGTGE